MNHSRKQFILQALEEDIGRGDLFSRCNEKNKKLNAFIVTRGKGVLAGEKYIKYLCKLEDIEYEFTKKDGDEIEKGDEIATFSAKANTLLKCERTLLNILQHASGIATHTHNFVQKAHGLRVLDTRKTRPLLREFEKYSVRVGGGTNHRMGLDDTLMLKDTHLATIKNLKEFVVVAREKIPWTSKIECECVDIEVAKKAFKAGVDIIMCDNMSLFEIREVVGLRDSEYPHVKLEASGNITIENIQDYTNLGVDAISTGSIIHQATWLDFSMKIAT